MATPVAALKKLSMKQGRTSLQPVHETKQNKLSSLFTIEPQSRPAVPREKYRNTFLTFRSFISKMQNLLWKSARKWYRRKNQKFSNRRYTLGNQ